MKTKGGKKYHEFGQLEVWVLVRTRDEVMQEIVLSKKAIASEVNNGLC